MSILLLFAGLSIVFTTLKIGISPMPTYGKVKRQFLAFLPETAQGPIYELGCGWGGLLMNLAKKYPEAKIIGYEISLVPFLTSWVRSLRKKNVVVRKKNYLKEPLNDARFFVCYLFPKGMRLLEQKIRGCNAKVYTHTFSFQNFEKIKEVQVSDIYRTKIAVYRCS